MTKLIGNSELLDVWASEGDTSEPFLSKRAQGWLYQERPASALLNFVQREQQEKINHLLKNGLSEWSTNTPYTRGACVKHANTAWRALLDNTASEPAPGNNDWKELDSLPIIRAPDLISPINGAVDVSTAAPLVASEYAPVYSVDDRDYRRFEVDVAGGDFSTPLRTNDVDADTWNVDPILDTSGGFIWRCRDVSDRGDMSPWSGTGSFTTGEVFVAQPSIASPADDATGIGETPTLTSSAFAVTGGVDTHAASFWRIFLGGSEVWASGRRTNALVSISVPAGVLADGETEYTVQVRHEGAALGLSSWSAASTFTTLDTFSRVATPAIVSPLPAETGILETPGFASGAFAVINGSDTHRASFWEVYTAADALVWSSGRSFTNRTNVTMPQGILQDGETGYKVRVRHEGTALGVSDWSPLVSFTTAVSFGRLFSGAANNVIRSINASGFGQRGTFTSHIGRINGLAYGGGFAYTASQDGTVRKLASSTLAQDAITTGSGLPVLAICYGTDGFVYTGSGDVVRKLSGSNLTQSAAFTAAGTVRALAFGGDGKLYVGAGTDVQQVDVSDMSLDDDYTGNTGNVLSLCFGTDGFVYSGSEDAKIRRINPSGMTSSVVFDGVTTTFSWSRVGVTVATIFSGRTVNTSLTEMEAHANAQFDAFSALNSAGQDGATVNWNRRAAGNGSAEVSVSSPRTGVYRVVSGFTVRKMPGPNPSPYGWGSSGTWLPGSGSYDWVIDLIEVRASATQTTGAVNALAFGTDGFLYAAFEGNTVRKLTAATLVQSGLSFTGHTQPVRSLTFGSDGFVYSGGADNAIRKINPTNMTQAGLFQGNTSAVTALAYNVSIPDLLEFPL